MIQRVQSIYLLIATVCYACAFFVDFASVKGLETVLNFGVLSGTQVGGYSFEGNFFLTYAPYINGVLVALVGATIFLFKNRKNQLKLAYVAYGIALLYIVLIFLGLDKVKLAFASESEITFSYLTGTYLPVASIAFLILAHRAIKKDEELVKSVDRLR